MCQMKTIHQHNKIGLKCLLSACNHTIILALNTQYINHDLMAFGPSLSGGPRCECCISLSSLVLMFCAWGICSPSASCPAADRTLISPYAGCYRTTVKRRITSPGRCWFTGYRLAEGGRQVRAHCKRLIH